MSSQKLIPALGHEGSRLVAQIVALSFTVLCKQVHNIEASLLLFAGCSLKKAGGDRCTTVDIDRLFKARLPPGNMKAARKVGLDQSIGLGLLLIAGCAGLVILMSYATL